MEYLNGENCKHAYHGRSFKKSWTIVEVLTLYIDKRVIFDGPWLKIKAPLESDK